MHQLYLLFLLLRLEKLGKWEDALSAYRNPTSPMSGPTRSLRQLTCLNELSRWDEMQTPLAVAWDEVGERVCEGSVLGAERDMREERVK